jgi:hypothetical protein
MNTPELRAACARQLQANAAKIGTLQAFGGFDGFVDEILHVVAQRETTDKYVRLPTIAKYAMPLTPVMSPVTCHPQP